MYIKVNTKNKELIMAKTAEQSLEELKDLIFNTLLKSQEVTKELEEIDHKVKNYFFQLKEEELGVKIG